MEITIRGTNLELTPALKRYATKKVASLEKFFPGVTIARVELERTTKHHHKGNIWRAEVNLDAPQHVFRAEAVGADLYGAIDAVKDELKRELQGLKEKRQVAVRRARRAKIR